MYCQDFGFHLATRIYSVYINRYKIKINIGTNIYIYKHIYKYTYIYIYIYIFIYIYIYIYIYLYIYIIYIYIYFNLYYYILLLYAQYILQLAPWGLTFDLFLIRLDGGLFEGRAYSRGAYKILLHIPHKCSFVKAPILHNIIRKV